MEEYMTIQQLLKENREEILKIAARHGAGNVRVFGSAARGQAGPDSDIDLLVDLEKGRGLIDHAAMLNELEDLLGCNVDVVTEAGIKSRIKKRVTKEAIVL